MNNKEYLILSEIDEPTYNRRFFPLYAFVYMIQIKNDYTGLISDDFNPELIGYYSDKNINSVSVLNTPLLSVNSIQYVIDNESSYYYDRTNYILYVHFPNSTTPHAYADNEIKINVTNGIYKSNIDNFNGSLIGQQYYPRLKGTGKIRDIKDNLYYGKQKFSNNFIEIENHDLRLVNFNIGANVTQKNFGGLVKIKVYTGSDTNNIDYDNEFITIYQGRIEKITEGLTNKLDLTDLRLQYDKSAPNSTFDLVGNSYGESGLTEDPTNPQIWGDCKKIPTICLNKNADVSLGTTDDYYFLVASNYRTIPTDAIENVYINGTLQKSLSSGALELFETDNAYLVKIDIDYFASINDAGDLVYQNMDKLTLDIRGYEIGTGDDYKRGLYIMNEILNDNYNVEINTLYYDDPTEFIIQADESYRIGYYLKKPKEVYKQLGEISASLMGYFIITPELKLKWTTDDETETKLELPIYKQLGANYVPNIEQDPSEVLGKIRVGYLKEWDNDKNYQFIEDNTNESNALLNYNSRKSKDFETLIINSTDIEDYITRLKVYTDVSNDTIKVSTILDSQSVLLKAGDYIEVYVDITNKTILGRTIQQIQSVSIDYENLTIDITGRIMRIGDDLILADENGKLLLDENNDYIAITKE